MSSMSFLLLLLAISFTASQWSSPVRVDDNCMTELRRAAMFADQHSRTTHYFWCEYDTLDRKFNLMYRRQYPNGIFSPVEILDDEHECEQVSVTGMNDGEQIFVAYAADRRSRHTHCSIDTRDGCLDIYTLNSADGGFTWSMVKAVPRHNMDDIWNRQYPKIIANKETGRVWVFYVLSNVEADMFSVGFVTKPEGSIIYSPERLLGIHKELIMGVTVALSKPGNRLLIHLIWTGEVQKQLHLMQAISYDNGNSWTTSEIMKPGFAGRFISDLRMDPTFMVLPYLANENSKGQLAVTHDWTRNWQLITISQHPGIADAAVCFKSSKRDGIVFSLLSAEVGSNKFVGEFGYMRLSDGRWIHGTNPFKDMNLAYDPMISCYVEDGKFVVKAIAIENSDYGQNKIYLAQTVIS